jgi:hypothetical protein
MSKEGNYNYNITIQGESGSVTVPENVNLSLFDCNAGNLTALGNNAIFLARSTVGGITDTRDGTFIAEDTTLGGEVFWRDSTRVWITRCSFGFRVSAINNTLVDISYSKWDGAGSFALRCLTKSRGLISKSKVVNRTKGAWAEDGSFIEVIDCTVATETGLIAEKNSMVRMIGGENNATKVSGEVKQKSQLYLSNIKTPLIASSYHIKASDYSRFHAEGTNFEATPPTSIKATNQCTIEVVNFDRIESTGGNCIDVDNECDVLFIHGKGKIQSLGGKAIKATNRCRVRTIDVKLIKSLADTAVFMDTESKFTASKCGTIISDADIGIKATNNSTISVSNHEIIQGLAGEGVVLDTNSRGWFAGTQLITSIASDAIKMSNEADLSLQDCQAVIGVAGNGIVAENDCTVQLQTVESIIGILGSGIVLKNNTNLDVVYTELIQGVLGKGIDASSNCDVRIARSSVIRGMTGGIINVSNGTVTLELVALIMCDTGFGISLQNKIDTTITLCKVLKGIETLDCDVKIKDSEMLNDSGTALSVTGGRADLRSIAATGTGASISLTNTTAIAATTTLNQSIVSANSVVTFEGVTLNGQIESANDVLNLKRATISLGISAAASAVSISIGTIGGALSFTNCTIDMESVLAAAISCAACSIRTRLVTGAALNLASTVGDLMGGSFATIAGDPTSSIIVMKCGGAIAGVGNIINMDGGIVTPGTNQISMYPAQEILIQNALNAKIDMNLINIWIDALTAGGNITLSSTVATLVI